MLINLIHLERLISKDSPTFLNYSPFLNLHMHDEGIGTWNSAMSKRKNDGGEEMGFGLKSWHAHHGLNGQRWQGSIIAERAASLLPVAVT